MPERKIPRISDTEWELMRIVWAHRPCTSAEIIATLKRQDPTWHPNTVKTLLNRLVKKQALGFQPEGRTYLYVPLVSEKDCVQAASDSFLERVFGGSLRPLLLHFAERKKLSSADLAELKRVLEEKG